MRRVDPKRSDLPCGPRVPRRRRWSAALLSWILVAGLAPWAWAEDPPERPSPPSPAQALEDSLRQELRERQRRLQELRVTVSGEDEQEIAEAVEGLETIITEIESELSSIEVEVRDDAILFSNSSGDLRISIPEDLGERVSESINAITATILSEVPDSVDFEREIRRFREAADGWRWDDFAGQDRKPKRKKVIGEDIFAFDDDIVVAEDEQVQGEIVVIMGDAAILGEVTGSVTVLGGELVLGEEALTHGDVNVLFGRLRRDEQAQVDGSVNVVSPGSGDSDLGALISGRMGFAAKLTGILVLAVLVLLVLAVVPGSRLDVVDRALREKTARSFGVGLLWLSLGHLLLLVVIVVLAATVIGIPLALLLGLGYVLLGLLAVGAAARLLGERLLGGRRGFLAVLAGLLLVFLPSLLGAVLSGITDAAGVGRLLEFLGLMLHAAVYSLGSGALLLTRFGGRD